MLIARVRRSTRATGLLTLLLLAPVLLLQQGCTDLKEDPSSAITPDNFYQNEEEVLGGLAGAYAQMRSTVWSYFNLSVISSDEGIVPTRGQDWFDNGRWLEIHRQAWAANSPAGLEDINGAWNDAFTGIARANALIEALENVTVANAAGLAAEARTLRAFFYYILMDLFGGVPIVTTTEIAENPRNTRAEVFQFIEQELTEARADLPDQWDASNNGRMTKGVANAILANMYLNAGVFARDDGVSATSYNSCTQVQIGGQTACDAAIAAADRILNSGQYSLATDWRSNFTADNSGSPENILVVKHLNESGLGLNLIMRTLHYNQFNPSPWNGFAILADAYNAFDADDERTQIFLVGPQVNLETGDTVTDRSGALLVFTPDIADATQATEGEGVRVIKYPPDPNHVAQENGNDFVYFRLGEMYLIKAEALNELSPGSAQALALLNTLRERVFDPDEPLGAIDRDVILEERLFELTWETKRRQDLIRHGRFTQAWAFKDQGANHLILMPIPQSQMDVNPQLTQNTGY